MIDWILLAIGIAGFGAAGYWDLKTTEFPDWLPYAMILLALAVRGVFSFLMWDAWILLSSAITGALFLGFGLVLYYSRQWGDGDAWLLGALGFLFPSSGLLVREIIAPFPLAMLFNFFVLSFAYLIIYSLAVGIRIPGTFKKFRKEFRKSSKGISVIGTVFFLATGTLIWYINMRFAIPFGNLVHILGLPALLVLLLVFVEYGKFIESRLFRRQIPASELKIGDVPLDAKWRCMTASELKRLKKRGGKVWIKEGARLAPVFLATVLVTVFWGFLLV